jgi:hypothetical protein
MTISRERFDDLRTRWSSHSSWAVWQTVGTDEKPKAHVGDRTVLDPETNPELLNVLNPEVVMVGLNASSREGDGEAWANFHDGDSRANDFKIRFAFEGTPFWGAYMTDVFVNFPETDSRKVMAHVKANPDAVAEQLDRLARELQSLGTTDPLLIAFGGLANDLIRQTLGDKYRVIKVPHYAHRIGKEKYRAKVLEALERGGNSALG